MDSEYRIKVSIIPVDNKIEETTVFFDEKQDEHLYGGG